MMMYSAPLCTHEVTPRRTILSRVEGQLVLGMRSCERGSWVSRCPLHGDVTTPMTCTPVHYHKPPESPATVTTPESPGYAGSTWVAGTHHIMTRGEESWSGRGRVNVSVLVVWSIVLHPMSIASSLPSTPLSPLPSTSTSSQHPIIYYTSTRRRPHVRSRPFLSRARICITLTLPSPNPHINISTR
ncbi:hypothetical protein AB1N83_012562 [Pleurotus pulmonarius]